MQIAFAFGPTLAIILLIDSHSHEIAVVIARLILPLVGTKLVPLASVLIVVITLSVFGFAFAMIQRWLLPNVPEKD
jgi:hypothetical protein